MSDKAGAARRREGRSTAHIDVVCPGMLEILSVGKGDIKLSVGGDDAEEQAKAQQIIEEMLRKGYGLFVETDEGLARVREFNPKRMTYIISDVPQPAIDAREPQRALPHGSPEPKRRGRPPKREKEVPVAGSRATAIGRTSGG